MNAERVIIFIDGSNLYYGLKHQIGNTHLDFYKFSKKLAGERHFIRTYYYNAPVKQEQDRERHINQQKFFSNLYKTEYLTVRMGRLETRIVKQLIEGKSYDIPTWVEKGVDTSIVVDMLSMAYKNIYDTAILVSGDGDFAGALEAIKELGKHAEVAYTSYSYHLRQACDKYVLLTHGYLKDCFVSLSYTPS
jgi:uncharacterized LabA/DUF88 family protein